MILQSYRISTLEGTENIYDAKLRLEFNVFKFELYKDGKKTGKLIVIPTENVYRLETIDKDEQVSDGSIIISNEKFLQYSKTVEAYDAYLNGDDDFFDPAS